MTDDPGLTMLLLGVYGMETVECGGILAKNARAGGRSFASIMLSREASRPQVRAAADVLGVEVSFSDFQAGGVQVDVPSKKRLVKVIREIRPDIIITQDPEHSFHDLDPDRRLAMILILESIALAARDFALDEMAGLTPHPIPTIYYITPHHPNCIVDISDVWDLKEQAMDKLESQMRFSGQMFPKYYQEDHLRLIVPNWDELTDDYSRGREVHRQLDRVTHLHNGAGAHSHFAFAEAYRREGKFHLQQLMR
jgi:LmbE family N-acetylglucosaminyl deacetylase